VRLPLSCTIIVNIYFIYFVFVEDGENTVKEGGRERGEGISKERKE
jgi:hypothetical protein